MRIYVQSATLSNATITTRALACGAHALSCPKGGFPSIRYNKLRDTAGCWMVIVVTCASSHLTTNHWRGSQWCLSNNRGLDIAANGSWGGCYKESTLMWDSTHPCLYLQETWEKQVMGYECVREVEHGSLTLLVMSLTVGLVNPANICYEACSLRNRTTHTVAP